MQFKSFSASLPKGIQNFLILSHLHSCLIYIFNELYYTARPPTFKYFFDLRYSYNNNLFFLIQHSLSSHFYLLKTGIAKRIYFYVILFFVYYAFNLFSHPCKLLVIKSAFKDTELCIYAKPFHFLKYFFRVFIMGEKGF